MKTFTIPNMITLCNLLSGCVAIYMAFHLGTVYAGWPALWWCWLAIGCAAVFDFCDGLSARLLGQYSPVGKELDSLSDLVSFGVAPGMLMLNCMLQYSQHPWLCFAALAIPAFGALRLAKFNVDDSQSTSFRGLPIPANALFWIGMSAWITRHGYFGTAWVVLVILLVAGLMTSNIPMFSLKVKNLRLHDNFRQYIVLGAAVMFLAMWGVSGLMWTILLYIAVSVAARRA